MARVTTDLDARIEHYLDYLLDEWAGVPDLTAEWPDLERHEPMDLVHEWPIRESYMAQLRRYAECGALTSAQHARYQQLLRLAEQHRPALETLLRDGGGTVFVGGRLHQLSHPGAAPA